MKTKTAQIFLLVILILLCNHYTSAQIEKSTDIDSILSNMKNYTNFSDTIIISKPYKAKEFSIIISKNYLPLDTEYFVIKNPYDNKYPLSYSVIYKDKLIALFEPGNFVCFSIQAMQRDTEFEKMLNTKKFQYHWIIDNKLVGLSNKLFYYLSPENIWIEYKTKVPFTNQPKLFEDDNYISFSECHGEYGGAVYFYNKNTLKTHFYSRICANSIIKRDNKYYVLSNGAYDFSKLIEIANPEKLSLDIDKNVVKIWNNDSIINNEKKQEIKTIFNFWPINLWATFVYDGRTIYLLHWSHYTCLAEIENDKISIINPLFNKEIYTHNPITTNFDNTILINLDLYGTALEREVSCVIIKNGKLIKIDWNENHFL